MLQDIRFGIRMLLKSPGFTALALVTLALGIGANTTIFSIVNSVLLRPLPYEQPERIVQLADSTPVRAGQIPISFPKFTFLQQQARSFSALGAVGFARFQVTGPAPAAPAEIQGARVSIDFFRTFGAKPAAGRTFLEDEERPGGNSVAVISYGLWQNRFNGDPGVIGRNIGVDGSTAAVIGVMPAGFEFPSGVEIWVPRVSEHSSLTRLQIQNGAGYLMLWGRLADGANIQRAQAEAETISRRYDKAHPGFGDIGRGVKILPLRESLVSDVRQTLLVLLGAVAFVLLIASANVANLLLARAIARQKEVAIRASLGASRRRLLVQFLTESVLLATLGAGLGLLLSVWSIRLVTQMGSRLLPHADEIRLDSTVLLFTAAAGLLSAILFGFGPAMHSARIDLNEALKSSNRTVAGGGRLRSVMIVSEVALAMILLTGAGLLLRSFLSLESVDPGFRPANLLTARISLPPGRYPLPAQRSAFFDRVLERVAAMPGVSSAAVASALPINGRNIAYFFNIEGRPKLESSKAPVVWLHSVSPGYFETMGIPVLSGRTLTGADNAAAPLVGVINQTMARRHWPNEDPIGKRIVYSREALTLEIVGVAADIKIAGLDSPAPYEQLWVPYRQKPWLTMFVVTRSPVSMASAIRHEVLTIDQDQPVTNVQTMHEVISDSLSEPRLRTALIGSFAALALILAMIGIGGVVAWSVSQRTNEIGIRMALGARPSDVLTMIARQAFIMIGTGQLLGLAGAFALTRVLSTFLFGVSPEDPMTFGAVIVLLAAVALFACVVAARRALRIDPVDALRLE